MEFKNLLKQPRETLNFEFKQWFCPTSASGKAKIIKAAIALRNNNGGHFAIGITDEGSIQQQSEIEDIDKLFHQDTIQHLITKHSSETFEIIVTIIEYSGARIPIISVPPGVRTPVAVKLGIKNPSANNDLLTKDTVYVRTLESNFTPSTAAATSKDWPKLMDICFNNREADIGSFVRRHLTGINLDKIMEAISIPTISPEASAERFLNSCYNRFLTTPRKSDHRFLGKGLFECSFIIESTIPAPYRVADTHFLKSFIHANPSHSGWPFWMDPRGITSPKTKEDGWEVIIEDYQGGAFPPHLDYWRAEPTGKFYHIRHLWEDTIAIQRKQKPDKNFAFDMAISDVAEVISTGLSFAKSMNYPEEETRVTYTFRWSGLKDRILTSADVTHFMSLAYICHDDCITEHITLPLDVSPSAFVAIIPSIVARLFSLFDGKIIDNETIIEIAQSLLNERY